MAGHNKWSSIKHKKAKTDAQKGKFFSKVSREIIIAVKLGGDSPDMNPRLRLAIQKAKQVNMPNENIKRAIIKGAGNDADTQLEEITYEAYGPQGVALLIETLTDNKNRTVPNIRAILVRHQGSLATSGAVSYLFNKKGIFIFEPNSDENAILESALLCHSADIDTKEDGTITVLVNPDEFDPLKSEFDSRNMAYDIAEITMIPTNFILLSELDADPIINLIEKLEDDEDVQTVHANFDIITATE
jgi:YebC/PmpR family DNA-binding regulatory protein